MPEKGILISEYPFTPVDESFPIQSYSHGIKPRPVESRTVNAVSENGNPEALAFHP